MITHSVLLHGLKLTARGEEPVIAALQSRLGQFESAPAAAAPDLLFEFHEVPDSNAHVVNRPPGAMRSIADPGRGEVLYLDDSDQLYIDFEGRSRGLCDPQPGRVRASYPRSEPFAPWLLSHPFFTFSLAELLKRRGLYPVHAAGLALAGKGLLVAGASGSGKTTLTLALLRAGFEFLADDTVFLSTRPSLRVLAFPDELGVTDRTAAFFPELKELPTLQWGPQKHSVCASRLYRIKPCWKCDPTTIIFPKVGQSNSSRVIPMPKAEALLELACNVLRTESGSSQAHLDALAMLVKNCRCYRCYTGRDFDALPLLLRSLLTPSS